MQQERREKERRKRRRDAEIGTKDAVQALGLLPELDALRGKIVEYPEALFVPSAKHGLRCFQPDRREEGACCSVR